MSTDVIIIALILVAGFIGLAVLVRRQATPPIEHSELLQTVMAVAKDQLDVRRQEASADLSAKQHSIEAVVTELRTELQSRQHEMRTMERERSQRFGEIAAAVDEHRKLTSELRGSTDELRRVLSSSQLRGSWGERQAEQIFTSIGFIEERHYVSQRALNGSSVRPDFTIYLPASKTLCIDVKFPFANLQQKIQAETDEAREQFGRQFASDVRARVREISDRGYIAPEHGTCDYAIMFVPNEAVFEYVNRVHPDIVDEALSRRVLMASPYSLVAIVRTIIEAYRNFYYESSMRDIIAKVDDFLRQYEMFKDEFEKAGRTLDRARADYEQIAGTRFRGLDRRIEAIQAARNGTEEGEVTAIESQPVAAGDHQEEEWP